MLSAEGVGAEGDTCDIELFRGLSGEWNRGWVGDLGEWMKVGGKVAAGRTMMTEEEA